MVRKWLEWLNQSLCSWHRQATLLFLVALFVVGMGLPIADFKAKSDHLGRAQTLSNLSLAYQQLGQ